MGQSNSPQFFSERQAAEYLSISLSTIRRWRRNGTGPAFFRFGDVLRYRRDTLDDFISRNTTTAS